MKTLTFTFDGHDYRDDNGSIYEACGRYVGEVFKSECGEYWVYEGDSAGQVHENEIGAYRSARELLITGDY